VTMNQVALSSETSPTIPSSATPRAARPSPASPSRSAIAASTTASCRADGFFRCTAWRSVAENASRTLKKGMRVFVAGKLVQRTWQDESSSRRQIRRDPG
jgi:single-stranded DNA-binding protein